jgi:hypothetical protein
MDTDAEVIAAVRDAFASCPRPEHFTNYEHCCECEEHDAELLSANIDTLSLDVVGNAGWDPICFVTPEGFAYYLPALARLALDGELPQRDWYGPQLFFHLTYDGPGNVRWQHCTPLQRRAVARLLEHIMETRGELIEKYTAGIELLRAIDVWVEPDDASA